MKNRIPRTGYFLLALWLAGAVTCTCSAESLILGSGAIRGFGKLTWGIPVEQAEILYPDLYFGAYEIVNRKEEPVKIYYRRDNPEKIDGVAFESYEYGFNKRGFSMVRASLTSKFGPRTLMTRAESAWDQMVEHLVRKYGEPKERRTEYVTEYLVVAKEMRWEAGDVFIRLKYKGPEGANEDQLIFEMGK